jgi:hypothetical protein
MLASSANELRYSFHFFSPPFKSSIESISRSIDLRSDLPNGRLDLLECLGIIEVNE